MKARFPSAAEAREFQRCGVAVVPNFMDKESFREIGSGIDCLNSRGLWKQSAGGDPLADQVGKYAFSFDQYFCSCDYPIILPFRKVRRFYEGKQFAAIIGKLTGLPVEVGRGVVSVSRYRAGSFISEHLDADNHNGRKRLCACVLYLTPNWRPHWGGHLLIAEGDSKALTRTILPQANTLVVFRTPRPHVVTSVGAIAQGSRYALFGWMEGWEVARAKL